MIKDKALENPRPSGIIGQHVMPLIPVGKVGFRKGMYMASADELYITVKGKGYAPAENGNKTTWHAPGTFDKVTGEIFKKIPTTPQAPKYQDVFGHTLVELAEMNPKIMGVTPAMPSSCHPEVRRRSSLSAWLYPLSPGHASYGGIGYPPRTPTPGRGVP